MQTKGAHPPGGQHEQPLPAGANSNDKTQEVAKRLRMVQRHQDPRRAQRRVGVEGFDRFEAFPAGAPKNQATGKPDPALSLHHHHPPTAGCQERPDAAGPGRWSPVRSVVQHQIEGGLAVGFTLSCPLLDPDPCLAQ